MRVSNCVGPCTFLAVLLLAVWCMPAHGATWQPMNSGTTVRLMDVWGTGPGSVYAVGHAGTILHYDGSSWTTMSSPTGFNLEAVTGWGTSSAIAVGRDKTVLRYDGTSWSPVTGVPGAPSDTYTDVWGISPDNFFMVGEQNFGDAPGLILHWDGVSWDRRTIDLPSGAPAMSFTSVWGRGPDDVYVAGLRYGGEPRALLYHFDGTDWTQDTSLPVGMQICELWGEGSNLFMVGAGTGYPNQPGMMWRLGASGWETSLVPIGPDTSFNGVWGSGSNDIYAVGYDFAIVHYDGNGSFNWAYETPLGPHDYGYAGIWGSGPGDIFVVGANGAILHGTTVPAPAALVLGGLGVSLVGWLRRRRAL